MLISAPPGLAPCSLISNMTGSWADANKSGETKNIVATNSLLMSSIFGSLIIYMFVISFSLFAIGVNKFILRLVRIIATRSLIPILITWITIYSLVAQHTSCTYQKQRKNKCRRSVDNSHMLEMQQFARYHYLRSKTLSTGFMPK